MMLSAYLEKKSKRYCNLLEIESVDGKLKQADADNLKNFLIARQKQNRLISKDLEIVNYSKVRFTLSDVMEKLKPTESPIEEILVEALIADGWGEHIKTQLKIGKYRVDIAVPKAKLIIECDGREYHHTHEYQIERDQKRDKYLARKGWRVKHYDGRMIMRCQKECLVDIRRAIKPFINRGKK